MYGYIKLNKRELCLIDIPIFQRLRRIKQLGMTHLVYPSAVHTRFEHSLGTMYISNIIINKLKDLCYDVKNAEAIRAAALLHDMGHGPFSHTFENVLAIIKNQRKDIPKIQKPHY